ncbi:MAG TPA: hypothetical protein VFQ22_14315 [Longimicrobiales bacterium]|nr:hypothetical protein [Longimicrobiales bacterium]
MSDRPAQEPRRERETVRPFHAREVATGQEAAELVAATLEHAAQREEAARRKSQPKGQPKWMLPLGLNLAVLAAYLLIAPPAWVVVNPIQAPAPQEQVQGLRTGMFMEIQRIEGFRLANGRLPSTLSEAGSSAEGTIEYTVRGDAYTLVATVGEETLVFDSSMHDPRTWVGRDLSEVVGRS